MSQTITQSRLRIDANFKRFVDEEVLPGTGLDAAAFWLSPCAALAIVICKPCCRVCFVVR